MAKKQNTKAKAYRGYVVPSEWDEDDGAEKAMLMSDDIHYILDARDCELDPNSFIDCYVEVVGSASRQGDEKVLAITSIREIPGQDDEDEEDYDGEYDQDFEEA